MIGLATAVRLAELGADVVCLEAHAVGSGQSRGEGRLFRHLHHDDRLIEFARETRPLWDAWSTDAGVGLLGAEGVLLTLPDPEAQHQRLVSHDVDAVLLDRAGQASANTVLTARPPSAVFDRHGGVIRAKATLAYLAARLGSRLQFARVLSVSDVGQANVHVMTEAGPLYARQVLFAAGFDTPDLARASGIELEVAVRHHVRATFAVREPPRRMSAWIDRLGLSGAPVYGGPSPDGAHFSLGLNGVDADAPVEGGPAESADLAQVAGVVREGLPGLWPQPVDVTTCATTSLPGSGDDFSLASSGPIHAFAGNNLFKFAPGIARLLAAALTSGERSPLLSDAPP